MLRILILPMAFLLALMLAFPPASGAVQGQLVFNKTSTAWESYVIFRPYVIHTGSSFMMWYSGEDNAYRDNIGLATSNDGLHWTRSSKNPVLKVGSLVQNEWDSGSVNQASVIYDQGVYKMYYSGQIYDTRNKTILAIALGLATSLDGVVWTKHAENPILTHGSPGQWDDKWIHTPTVILSGDGYVMYYRGTSKSGAVASGMATSTDGIHWTKKGKVNLPSAGWDRNYNFITGVILAGNNYAAVYHGNAESNDKLRIGAASSSDGVSWTPYYPSPLVEYGSTGWDSGGVYFPMVLSVGDSYYVYYTANGASTSVRSFGLAILPASQYPIPELPTTLATVAILLAMTVFAFRRKKTGARD